MNTAQNMRQELESRLRVIITEFENDKSYFGKSQELADLVAIEYMARHGSDPRELYKQMKKEKK